MNFINFCLIFGPKCPNTPKPKCAGTSRPKCVDSFCEEYIYWEKLEQLST